MLKFDIDANVRTTHGKGAARTLRRDGQTPAVLYGSGGDAVSLELNTRVFTKTLHQIKRRNAVISLAVADGKKKKVTHHVMIKEIQVDPVKDTPVHADFCAVDLETPIVLAVPLRFSGKAKGVELGGFMNISMHKVNLKGLIMDIPDFIELDVSQMNIGDHLICKSLTIPGNVEILEDPERTFVSIVDASKSSAEGAEGADAAGTTAQGGSEQAAGEEEKGAE
ncbi:MAG: 50S ribosomal protein L25 [Proteobacteria bacterium]|nr:50S ribosomal protein L25 [Pseudomonadota bacterium]MBU1739240.1 50S ribosomal protein L25 [Pseudomonadota bacterium]